MKRTVLGIAFLALSSLLALAQQPANVAGDWEITVSSPRGERTSPMSIAQDGEKIKVTMTSPRGDESTGEGTVKGQEIEWTITRSTPRGDFTAVYKGKVEGDTMTGQVQMGDFGASDWKAVKKTS